MNNRVLLVDDDPVHRLIVQRLLKKTAFDLFVAESAGEAIKILRKTLLDCVLTDFHMPVSNGMDLLSFIRNNENSAIKDIPVILCTSDISLSKSELLNAGFSEILIKPVSDNDILLAIERTCNKKD